MKKMRSLFATGTIIGKIALLGCFSLFGGHCGISEVEAVAPCHQAAGPSSEVDAAEPCGQCENSVETWSEPITAPFIAEKVIPLPVAIPLLELTEEEEEKEVQIEPLRSPPDGLLTEIFKRTAKSTQWRSTAH